MNELFLTGFKSSIIIINNLNWLIDAYNKYATSTLRVVGLVENIALAFILSVNKRM